MRVGSLCTGVGGLELALEAALPASSSGWTRPNSPDQDLVDADEHELVFVSDPDPTCAAVLEARLPAENLGDWTRTQLPPVDLLVGGLPCQPVSVAGFGGGTDDERWLFDDLTDAIRRMGTRPDVFLENVPGMLTANGGHALARAVGGLAALGYVGRWGTLRASDVGAPHRRRRWWCYATADPDRLRRGWLEARYSPGRALDSEPRRDAAGRPVAAADPGGMGRREGPGPREGEPSGIGRGGSGDDGRAAAADADLEGLAGPEPAGRRQLPAGSPRRPPGELTSGLDTPQLASDDLALFPTPLANLGDGRGVPAPAHAQKRIDSGRRNLDDAVSLLPTPTSSQPGGTPEQMLARKPSHDGVRTEVTDLRMQIELLDGQWGKYSAAVYIWQVLTGLPAPPPLDDKQRLNPVFVEWMMGLPPGWITDLDIARTRQLRALGNAVVPAQGAAALTALLTGWP